MKKEKKSRFYTIEGLDGVYTESIYAVIKVYSDETEECLCLTRSLNEAMWIVEFNKKLYKKLSVFYKVIAFDSAEVDERDVLYDDGGGKQNNKQKNINVYKNLEL